jgi:hypothetical protein
MHKLLSDIVRPCWMAFAAIALTAAAPCALPAADDENIWTWMNGPSRINQETTFGTQGEASLSSSQGGRYEFSFASAPDGRLWVFGGVTHYAGSGVILDDLWQFNPSTLEWTWMKGSTTDRNRRISGTLGVPSPDNTPGSRTGSVLWCDNSGDLWLFGGKGYVDGFSSVVVLSDLWKFNPQTRQWTWVKGHSSPFQPPVYGNMGQADPANTPGARMYASGVKDSDGALWLFGGAYPDFTAYNNGLWRFTPDDENWTWIKGEDPFGLAASYGTMGVESPANTPGGRHKCVLWADQNGRIWMFGGHGRDVVDQHGRLSDLWRLDTSNGNWIWMKGAEYG